MNTNEVFDKLFTAFPKAQESKSMKNTRPKGDLDWGCVTAKSYIAGGPRGGILRLTYNERSNKITLSRKKL